MKDEVVIINKHICELCNNGEAAVYCKSDEAYLCWTCDVKVHNANFLVARHVRQPIIICSRSNIIMSCPSSSCTTPDHYHHHDLSHEDCLSSSNDSSSVIYSSNMISSTCSTRSSPFNSRREYSSSANINYNSSSSLSTASTTTTTTERRIMMMMSRSRSEMAVAEAILVNWCAKLRGGGVLDDHDHVAADADARDHDELVVRMACGVFMTMRSVGAPDHDLSLFRVRLAASMWLAFIKIIRQLGTAAHHNYHYYYSNNNNNNNNNLKRVEEISGVPSKLILSAASKMEKALTRLRRQRRREQQQRRGLLENDLEEGWDESSSC